MLCKNLRSEVHGRAVLLAWVPDRHRVGVSGLCVFSIPRVFYHCPTSSATPVSENTCRPGRKFFFFFYHDRPCVGHAAVQATPDCVHRVTVLCCAVYPVAYERPPGCVGSVLCDPAPAVPPCSTVSYCVLSCCAHPWLCCVGLLLCPLCCVLCCVVPVCHAGAGAW